MGGGGEGDYIFMFLLQLEYKCLVKCIYGEKEYTFDLEKKTNLLTPFLHLVLTEENLFSFTSVPSFLETPHETEATS